MHTKEIVKDITKSRSLVDELTFEIGELYVSYIESKDNGLLAAANEKAEVLKKVKAHIKDLEKTILTNLK